VGRRSGIAIRSFSCDLECKLQTVKCLTLVGTEGRVTANGDETARVWDASSGACLLTLKGHGGAVLSAAFSPDGRRIVTGSWDGTARVWDGSSGVCLLTLKGHVREVSSAAFSPDRRQIVSESRDGTLRIWGGSSGVCLLALEGHEGEVTSAAFSPGGRKIVTGSRDRTARLWDAASGGLIQTSYSYNDGWFTIHADGRIVYGVFSDNHLGR
jgi:WD40 repeat protein